LCQEIGNLPNVQELILQFTHEAPPLSITALERLMNITCTTETETAATIKTQLHHYQHLEYLHLNRVKLVGTVQDFDAFGQVLSQNKSITKVNLHSSSSLLLPTTVTDTNFAAENIESNINDSYGMNVLLQTLVQLPNLTSLHLDDLSNLSQRVLVAICQSPNLTLLELWNMSHDVNQHGTAMARVLASNNCLQELEISSNLQYEAGQAMINMLRTNTCLQTLGLDLDYVDGFGEAFASVFHSQRIKKRRTKTSALKTLHLRMVQAEPNVEGAHNNNVEHAEEVDAILSNTNNDDNNNDHDVTDSNEKPQSQALANILCIIRALETNVTLEHLHMNFYHLGPDYVCSKLDRAFSNLLEKNFMLQHMSLRGCHTFVRLQHDPDIGFKLQLNQAGRYHLLMGGQNYGDGNSDDVVDDDVGVDEDEPKEEGTMAPKEDWVKTITQFKEDISISFYLLSMNPSLCSKF